VPIAIANSIRSDGRTMGQEITGRILPDLKKKPGADVRASN
jgi:hypothetical protein